MDILYFRNIDNRLVRYKLSLDSDQILLSDGPYPLDVDDQSEVLLKFPHLAPQIAGGAKFKIQADGSLLATFVPKAQKDAYKFFAGNTVGFAGEDGLRAEFEARKEELGNPKCTDCSYGKLLREFLPVVMGAIAKSNVP